MSSELEPNENENKLDQEERQGLAKLINSIHLSGRVGPIPKAQEWIISVDPFRDGFPPPRLTRPRITTEEKQVCPSCQKPGEKLIIGWISYGICDSCRSRWLIGFYGKETPDDVIESGTLLDWIEAGHKLNEYDEVDEFGYYLFRFNQAGSVKPFSKQAEDALIAEWSHYNSLRGKGAA